VIDGTKELPDKVVLGGAILVGLHKTGVPILDAGRVLVFIRGELGMGYCCGLREKRCRCR
jgi:hypothetical protein